MIVIVILIVAASSLLAWAWIRGIDNMNENHPDYKGDDFLNIKGDVPWKDDEWNDKHHKEDV
jgi:hypothetical protein